MEIVVIPIATIVAFVVFCIIGLMLCMKQRRKNQQVFVPRHNLVTMPMQPTNPQFQMPMHLSQPIPQPNPHLVNPMRVPQPFLSTPNPHLGNITPIPQPFLSTPNPHLVNPTSIPQSIPRIPSPHLVHPMPVPQPFPSTSPIPNPASSPDPPTQDLMDRMRQVQTLMVEIHRLESSSGERNTQRVHELKQRIVELSNTDDNPLQTSPGLESAPPPPAYFPRDNGKQ